MHAEARQGYEVLLHAEYRTSSYSSGAGECVAVGYADQLAGVKDSKNPAGDVLAVPATQWAEFIHNARNGQFDL